METEFKVGDEVKFKDPTDSVIKDLASKGTFIIAAVRPLLWPNHYYVDPYYWDRPEWGWARNKTRLQIAGHGQSVFLKGVLATESGRPTAIEGLGSFSGVWFEIVRYEHAARR